MSSLKTKIPAMIGMGIYILVWGSLAVFMILDLSPEHRTDQWFRFACLVIELLLFGFGYLCFFVDGILSVIKCFLKIDPAFNIALFLTILFSGATYIVSLFICIGTTLIIPLDATHLLISWGVISLAIFVLEIVSIVRCAKANR